MKKPVAKKPVEKKKKIIKSAKKPKKLQKARNKAKNKPIKSRISPPKKKRRTYNPLGGRPPKYDSVEELERMIKKYFKSCWTQKVDLYGNLIYIKDKKGKKTNKKVMVQFKPYTLSGIAVTLGIDRDTLLNYSKKKKFVGTIKRAKQMCQQYAEESLFIGKNPAGAIFNLKNNYGWKDKQETEHTGSLIWKEESPK